MPSNQRGFAAQILLIVVLVLGVILAVYLIGTQTNIIPHANEVVSGPISNPINSDSDNDGFTDPQEAYMGTDLHQSCALNPSDNAWPVDVNNDRSVTGEDVSFLVPYINGSKPYNPRYDLNQDHFINQSDVTVIQQYFLKTCTVGQPRPSVPVTAGAGYALVVPGNQNLSLNQKFNVNLVVSSSNEAANTFAARINFNSDKLEVESIAMDSNVGSFITQTDDKFIDNTAGKISLLGGLISPGLKTTGSNTALMAVISFKVKQAGPTSISFDPASKIASNDTNKNILVSSPALNLTLGTTPSPIPSPVGVPSACPIALPICDGDSHRTSTIDPTTSCPIFRCIPNVTPPPSISPTPTPSAPANIACALDSVSWSTTSSNLTVQEGTLVKITVNGNKGCIGKQVSFEVKEDDGLLGTNSVKSAPSPVTFSADGVATTSWLAEFQQDGILGIDNPPEYFVTAAVAGNDTSVTSAKVSANELKVNRTRQGEFINGDGNNDGKVDELDLSVLRSSWNKSSGFPQAIDINDDGIINSVDYTSLIKILQINGIIHPA